jgi:glycosyltransferase involved in cell wall biosynthesis
MLGVSILMCSYNGQSNIESSVQAIASLDITEIPGVEFVFVDNGSRENLEKTVQKLWGNYGSPFTLKTFTERKPGKVSAFLKGLESVQGKYVVVCDDDNDLHSNYLQVGFHYLEKNASVGVLGGQGIPKSSIEFPHWFEDVKYNYACGLQALQTGNVQPIRNVIYGAGMWFRKSAFDLATQNGFHFIFNYVRDNPRMRDMSNGGEDGELCWAIKYQGFEVHYHSDLNFYHHVEPYKLSSEYYSSIIARKTQCTLFASLYYRVFNMPFSRVHNFWMKELFYIFINYFKNFKFNSSYILGEIKRNRSNIKMLVNYRNRYDDYVNQLLEFRDNSLRVKNMSSNS